jgi:hypothetical protein
MHKCVNESRLQGDGKCHMQWLREISSMTMDDRHGKGLHQMQHMAIKGDKFKPNLALHKNVIGTRWRHERASGRVDEQMNKKEASSRKLE